MAGDTITLDVIGTKTLRGGAGTKDIIEVVEHDVPTVIRGIAAQEIAGQIAIGNKPTHLIVDNKDARSVSEARYKVVALFVDSGSMVKALDDIWRELQRLSRHKTGRTASQFEVWISDRGVRPRRAGEHPGAVKPSEIEISTGLFIVGPMVPHTRKYQWLIGAGVRQQFRRSRAKRYKALKARDKPRVAYTIHQMAARTVQRKYPWLAIADVWIDVPNQNPQGKTAVTRIPTVAIWGRNKGALH